MKDVKTIISHENPRSASDARIIDLSRKCINDVERVLIENLKLAKLSGIQENSVFSVPINGLLGTLQAVLDIVSADKDAFPVILEDIREILNKAEQKANPH